MEEGNSSNQEANILGNTSVMQPPQVLFNFLEYLQDLKAEGKLNEESTESVEVSLQCLTSAFGLDLQSEEQKKQYSIKPQSLSMVLALGLQGRDKIQQTLQQLQMKIKQPAEQQPAAESSDLEQKFAIYIQAVKSKGFFNGVSIGTAAYELRFLKAREKFLEKYKTTSLPTESSTTSSTASSSVTHESENVQSEISEQERNEKAEEYKMEGNQKLAAKQFAEAVECYSNAIKMNPSNSIYYANRAAAYSHLGNHDSAIEDCKKSIESNPNYSKAYGRLGLAYFSQGKYKEAVEAYERALELEPNSSSFKESLNAAKAKLQPNQEKPIASTGNPNLGMFNNVMGNMMGGGRGGQGTNLNDLLSNPMLANMAQQFMQNPEMMNLANNLMQNPDAMNSMFSAFGVNPPSEDSTE